MDRRWEGEGSIEGGRAALAQARLVQRFHSLPVETSVTKVSGFQAQIGKWCVISLALVERWFKQNVMMGRSSSECP